MNECDQADAASDAYLSACIKSATNNKLDLSNPHGLCLNCNEPIGIDKRFCDSDCASDYSKRQWLENQK